MKIKNKPLVSVVIPTYNSEKTMTKCLESIKNQTYKHIEIIVVDNNSTDVTKDIARRYCDKLINQSGGMGVQINKGVSESKGEFVAFFDDDMYLGMKVIEECVDKYKQGCDAVVIPEKTLHNSFWAKVRDAEKKFYARDYDIEAARFYRRSVFLDVGGINENLKGFRDFDIHQKVKRTQHMIDRIDTPLVHDVDPDIGSILRKRFVRGESFLAYASEHPHHAIKIMVRLPLIKGTIKLFARDPALSLGLVVLKFGEYLASGFGLVVSKIRRKKGARVSR